MLDWYKRKSVTIARARSLSPQELQDRILVGEFLDVEKPEMIEGLQEIRARAGGV
jgi:2-oxoglutarate ferredoxin oxidoreductase subunit beta